MLLSYQVRIPVMELDQGLELIDLCYHLSLFTIQTGAEIRTKVQICCYAQKGSIVYCGRPYAIKKQQIVYFYVFPPPVKTSSCSGPV